jgi:hypothetical protein
MFVSDLVINLEITCPANVLGSATFSHPLDGARRSQVTGSSPARLQVFAHCSSLSGIQPEAINRLNHAEIGPYAPLFDGLVARVPYWATYRNWGILAQLTIEDQ